VVDDVQLIGDLCTGEPLQAVIAHNAPVCDGEVVRLVDASRGPHVLTEWDLDDNGLFAEGSFPEEQEENPRYVFPSPGARSVSLRVENAGGAVSTTSELIEVLPRPAILSLDVSPSPADEGQRVDFTAAVLGGTGDPALYTYEWEFGDGLRETGAAVQHTYALPGSYDVVLVVWDEAGCDVTDSANLEVLPTRPPDPIVGLIVERDPAGLRLAWQPDVRASVYNVYGGALPITGPVDPGCLSPPGGVAVLETVLTDEAGSRYFLVSGKNRIGEGELDAPGADRALPSSPCP
jgi:hypothetical protein